MNKEKIKAGYYQIAQTHRGKKIYILKGEKIFAEFRHIGGILEIKRSRWYIVLSWFDGVSTHNDVVKECKTKQEASEIASGLVGERTGRWKETVGTI